MILANRSSSVVVAPFAAVVLYGYLAESTLDVAAYLDFLAKSPMTNAGNLTVSSLTTPQMLEILRFHPLT